MVAEPDRRAPVDASSPAAPRGTAPASGAVSGFFRGIGMLFRGFGMWRRRPGLMWLGMVPAAVVALLVVAALILLANNLLAIVEWATPFADPWDPAWAALLRISAGIALFLGAIALSAVTFTGLSLAVGDPAYERIWRATEIDMGGDAPERGLGFWRSFGDAVLLILLGIVSAAAMFAVGFIPLIGSALAAVLGVVVSGRLLARELTSRSFEARGMSVADQRMLLPGHRAELLGFGVATQLCFLIPLGAIFVMPAAVVGSTMLARRMLDGAPK